MKILILFSTMMGTTKEVSKSMQSSLIKLDNQVDLYNVYDPRQINFNEYDLLIFGAPTYDEGLEWTMQMYIDKNTPDLSDKKIAIFGLGDKMYPLFCAAVDLLEKWVIKNSGKLIVPSLRIEGFFYNIQSIHAWIKQTYNNSINK